MEHDSALAELRIEWIAAHSPQAKGRIERLFGTLQDRLVKEMRLQQISTLEQANRFLEMTFWPAWQQRFARPPATSVDAHRSLERTQHLEEVLSLRVARTVAADHTVSWQGRRWGLWREDVCAGLRGARVEIERRLDDKRFSSRESDRSRGPRPGGRDFNGARRPAPPPSAGRRVPHRIPLAR